MVFLSIIIGLVPTQAFAAPPLQHLNGIVAQRDFSQTLLKDDELYDMAKKGHLINDQQTKVEILPSQADEFQVKITKKLKETSYLSGEIVENYVTTVTGEKYETGTSGAATVKMRVGFYYDRATFDNITCYKITSYYTDAYRLDNTFRLTKLTSLAGQMGFGYKDDGTRITSNGVTSSFTKEYPVSGTRYSKNTGFNFYIDNNAVSTSGSVTSQLYYQRNTGGTVYSYELDVSL